MNREVKAVEPHKHVSSSQQGSVRTKQIVGTTVPQAQRESRRDQEQEGTQNPTGDTRDVSREPVNDEGDPTKR